MKIDRLLSAKFIVVENDNNNNNDDDEKILREIEITGFLEPEYLRENFVIIH